jgi:hypothetical protein
MIFAACEESVSQVFLIDEKVPPSFDRIWKAFVEVAPWIESKVIYQAKPLEESLELPSFSGVLLVHACGDLTDRGLAVAARCGGPVAAMPCCYGKATPARVPGLSETYGYQATIDISRSFTLADAGYRVDWSAISGAITPMNRILVGWGKP